MQRINSMNWIQEFSTNKKLYNNLSCFLNQYGVSGLEQAFHLYRITCQTYICKNKLSISKINIYDIYYLKISRHYITIHTEHGIYHKYGTLKNELKILAPYVFINCSQSCIVSLNKIRDIHHQDVILINDEILHMSRNYINKVIIAFSQH